MVNLDNIVNINDKWQFILDYLCYVIIFFYELFFFSVEIIACFLKKEEKMQELSIKYPKLFLPLISTA